MLARKSLLIFLTNVVGGLFGLVGLFAVGRYMTPTAFGILGFTLSTVGIASFLGNLGYDSAHVKRVSEGRALGPAIGTFTIMKVALVALFAVMVLIGAWAWDRTLGLEDTSLAIVALVVLHYVAMQLRMVPTRTFDALRETAKTQAAILVEHLVKNPLVVVVALVFGATSGTWVPFEDAIGAVTDRLGMHARPSDLDGAFWLAAAYTVALVASLLAGLFLMRRHDYPIGAYDRELAKDYTAYALPIAILTAFGALANHVDSFMVGYFWSSADVGYYFAAKRITTTAMMVPTAVGTIFFPLISQLASENRHRVVLDVTERTQRYMSLVVVLLVMFMVMFPREGIHIIMSNAFLPAAPALQLMALWTLVMAFTAVAAGLIKGFDQPKALARAGIISLSANAVMNLFFIPDSFLGIPGLGLRAAGAALATVLAQVLQLVLLLGYTHRILGRSYIGLPTVKHLVAAGLTMGVMHLAASWAVFGGLDRFYELGAMGVFGTVLYLVLLIVMRDVGRHDLDLLLDTFDPRKMASYVHGEVRTHKGWGRRRRR